MRYLKNKKGEAPTESTGGVPTKDPLKVKSVIEESPITQKYTLERRRLGAYMVA